MGGGRRGGGGLEHGDLRLHRHHAALEGRDIALERRDAGGEGAARALLAVAGHLEQAGLLVEVDGGAHAAVGALEDELGCSRRAAGEEQGGGGGRKAHNRCLTGSKSRVLYKSGEDDPP